MVSKSLEQHVGSCFVSKAAQKSPKKVMLNVHFPYNRFKKKKYACKIPFVPMVHGHKFKFFSDPLYIFYSTKVTCIIEFKIRI